MTAPNTSYNSSTNLQLDNVPNVSDPEVYAALLELHVAIENFLRNFDESSASFAAYIAQRILVSEVKTADYSVLTTDGTIRLSGALTAISCTLYNAAEAAGKRHVFKCVDSTNTVTLTDVSGSGIDGAVGGWRLMEGDSITVQSNGTSWMIE